MRRTLTSVSFRFVLMTVVVCLGLAVFAAFASAAPATHVSGTVYDSNNQPVGANEVAVYLYRWNGLEWGYYDWDYTGTTGVYTFEGVMPGEYHVMYAPQDSIHAYQYYNDQSRESAADTLTVAADTWIDNLDAHLHLAATITGTVTDAPTSLGVESIKVELWEYRIPSGTWVLAQTQTTAFDGSYGFTELPQGTYRVSFTDTNYALYEPEYWADKSTFQDADDLVLAWGDKAEDIDAALARQTGTGHGASISGAVIGADTGWALRNAEVHLYRWDGSDWLHSGYHTADAQGRYLWTGLTAGEYRLFFQDPDGAHVAEYYDDAADLDTATSISLMDDQLTTGRNAAMSLFLDAVAGTVTDADSGEPLENVYVELSYDWGGYAGSAYTDGLGRYTLTGLLPGTYKVQASDISNVYFGEYYDNAATWELATPLVLDGSAAAIVDIGLQRAGEIAGLVTSQPTGLPIADVSVQLYRYSEPDDTWNNLSWTNTDGTGGYRYTGLEYGLYRLSFTDPNHGHLAEWYNNAPGLLDATSIEVTAAPDTANAVLAKAGTVTGTVMSASPSAALENVLVSLWQYDATNDFWSQTDYTAYTNAAGVYTITGAPDNTYRVRAAIPGYLPEYFEETTTAEAASDVVVAAPATVTDIDFTLDRGSTISGHVTEVVTGNPLPSSYVLLMARGVDGYGNEYWQATNYADYADASGNYAIVDVPPGTYRVSFSKWSPPYLTEFYPDERSVWNATDVVITVPSSVPNIDAELSQGGSISGTVTDSSLTELSGATVRAYAFDSHTQQWELYSSAITNSFGDYTFSTVPDDTYLLAFSRSGYAGEFYDNANDVLGATPVVMTNGAALTGRDAALDDATPAEYGSIEGTVVADSNGAPIQGVRVIAWRQDLINQGGWYWANSTQTNSLGHYDMTAQSGVYRLQFSDEQGRYTGEYYDDASELIGATESYVYPDETLVRSASLAAAASISGRVTGEPSGSPIEQVEVTTFKLGELGWYYGGIDYSDAQGNYTIGGLDAGTYRTRFSDTALYVWRSEYYNDKSTFSQADNTVLANGEAATGIDASLKSWGRVLGTVTGGDGRPVGDTSVTLYKKTLNNWDYYTQVASYVDGTYDSGNLEPGTYIVRVSDAWPYGPERYLTEYYGDTTRTADATQIEVSYDTENANVVLNSTGTWGDIAGTVTDAFTGDPIPDMPVRVWCWGVHLGDWFVIDPAQSTDAAGAYTAQWVPVGAGYRVGAEPAHDLGAGTPWAGIYAATYHLDSATLAGGLGVNVTPDALTSGVDVNVAPEATTGYLTSHVIEDGTGAPIAGTYLSFSRYDSGVYTFVGEGYTGADGTLVRPLPAGQYAVYVDDWPQHAEEYYKDVHDISEATLIEVTAASSTEITASLEPLSAISGTVTASNGGAPIENVEVDLYRLNGESWDYVTYVYTDANGEYELLGLPLGTYRVGFYEGSGEYAPEWYDNTESLDQAANVVLSTTLTTQVDAALDDAATISGVVTDATTGDPIEDAYARVYRYIDSGDYWQEITGTYTNVAGRYTLSGLRAGTYRVGFEDWVSDHVSEYYDGVRDIEDGTNVPVLIGEDVTGIDASMDLYAALSGTITDVKTGSPVPGAYVGLYVWNPAAQQWQGQWGRNTNASGFYSFAQVPPGTYRLYVQKSGYLAEYFDNRYEVESADDIGLASGQSRTIDLGLSSGASIQGTVTNPDSDPISGVVVTALRWSTAYGQWVGMQAAYTNASGAYSFTALGDGVYRIHFYDEPLTYAEEFYDGSTTIGGAQDVEIIDGINTENINAQLALWESPGTGWASGTVRSDTGGSPLGGITVSAYRYSPSDSWYMTEQVNTAADGKYSLALDASTYRIRFSDDSNAYLPEYFEDSPDDVVWSGDDITVSAGATSSVNASLAPSAHVKGTVTAAVGGSPLGGISVAAYKDVGTSWNWVADTSTGPDGAYDLGSLPAGSYAIEFADYSYLYRTEYFNNAQDYETATLVDLAPGEVITGIDAQLETNGMISGTITDDATGMPVVNARVQLYLENNGSPYVWQNQSTDGLGRYSFDGLPAATYLIEADDAWSAFGFTRFNGEFFDNQTSTGDATHLVITTNQMTADLALESTHTWGSISGKAVDAITGYPIADMPVVLYEPDGFGGWAPDYNYLVFTNTDGSYRLNYVPLNPDAYRMAADPDYSGPWGDLYNMTFYSSASTVELGNDVDLSTEAHHAGIDILVDPDAAIGYIDGIVVSEETSAPIEGIAVEVSDAARNAIGSTTTDADGRFSRAVLPSAGPFYVEFGDGGQNWVSEFYDDAEYDTADSVAVSVGTATSLEASLTPAGHITGSIRNSGGFPIEAWVTLYTADGTYIGDGYWADGRYSFDGLLAGDYKLFFASYNGYASEYWNDQSSFDTADSLSIATGETGAADATLAPAAFFQGTISSDDGLLISGVAVEIYQHTAAGWEQVSSQWTEIADGWNWSSGALRAGEYRVAFREQFGWYDRIWYPGASDIDSATSVWLAAGQTITLDQMLDRLPPTVGCDALASYENTASIEITAADLVSGVERIHYLVNGSEYHFVEADSATVLYQSSGDSQSLEYWATDNMGHSSAHKLAVFDIVDTIAPTVSDDAELAYPDTARIALTASDNVGGSGISAIYYRLDSAVVWTTAPSSSVDVVVNTLGAHTLYYYAEDNSGNLSEVVEVDFTVSDATAPEVHDDAAATYNDTATVHLSATDEGSGVASISYSLDNATWTVVNGEAASVTVDDPGLYDLWYKATDVAGNVSDTAITHFEVVRTAAVTEVPIAGETRFDTAVAVSEKAFPTGADWVVIATGRNWPDALGGSALAGALDGPILLTDTTAMPASVVDEIERLGASNAIILGGTAAVNASVESALNALLGDANVERIAGTNRYLTADAVGARAIDELGAGFDGTAFVATGTNYPDALAAAPLSAGLHWPLFLTKPTGIAPATTAAMAGVDEVLVLGGTSAVPAAIETALNTRYGGAHVTRLFGSDRYTTAIAVASHGVANGLEWNRLALATGEKFPDALAGGVLQGRDGSVMLLTKSTVLDPNVAAVLTAQSGVINEVRYLGGLSAITQGVRNAVANILN